jgi:hypothetical protein
MKRTFLLPLITMLALTALPVAAKDAVRASVSEDPEILPNPIVMNNGNPYSTGTFAVGTIQLLYTAEGTQFPTGLFASFTLNLNIKPGPTTGQQTRYPVNLTLRQTGSQNVVLEPETKSFDVLESDWSASTTVHISIPASVASDPDLNQDGTDLVANLQLQTPGGSHLDTPTSIQVHIKLVYRTTCLRAYNFITDQGFNDVPLTQAIVHVSGGRTPKVNSTSPGQMSDNVLVVNDCAADQTFNLLISLDPHFQTKGHNAVFTHFTSGYVDPDAFDLGVFGNGTPNGASLWLEDITLPAGVSFLARVHIGIITGNPPSWLPATTGVPAAGIFEGFAAALFAPGTGPTTLATAPLVGMAEPNPVATTLGFTVQ